MLRSLSYGEDEAGAVAEKREQSRGAAFTAASSAFSPPAVTLPKGGGAIRGIGEKFAANPVTGTASLSVPIATSPGRSGFGPQLSLSYDSGAGNGPFGFGWSLSLPCITRKTDKGLPTYRDAEEADVYILSGAEDLVPVLKSDGARFEDHTSAAGYVIHRYRPRIEGLFARLERWTDIATGEIYWRSITRDNIITLYGSDNDSRLFDPADPCPAHPTRVFSWLIREVHDDKGNAMVYEYAAEDGASVDQSRPNEGNRVRTANRYLKCVKYGNRVSRLVQPDLTQATWMFEVVFDYGDAHYEDVDLDPTRPDGEKHEYALASPLPGGSWGVRPDPFSTYRAGFEVRTYRRCQRVLMFHHIPDLPTGEKGYDGLVRSTEFNYDDLAYEASTTITDELTHQGSTRFASFMRSVAQRGFTKEESRPAVVRNGISYATYLKKSLPPLDFEYSRAAIQEQVREIDAVDLENLPEGLDGSTYRWVDLDGEGIPGILTEQANGWFYKRNLSPLSAGGGGTAPAGARLAPMELVTAKPNVDMGRDRAQFMDLAGDGQPDLVVLDGPEPGFYEHDTSEGWQSFRPFASRLNQDTGDPNLRFVDLDGDGHTDALVTEDDAFVWHPSLAEEGFGAALRSSQASDEDRGPRLVFADGTHSVYLADMSGDGLADLVRIRGGTGGRGEVCYWPNLGYGRFGAKIIMDSAPLFDHPDQFDQRLVRLADIDGSGTTDLLYLGGDGVRIYFNQSGNRLSEAYHIEHFPRIDNTVAVMTADLLGNGTACLVWSSPLPADAGRPLRYIDLMGGTKPHLLVKAVNNLGAETEIQYAPSTRFYLTDKHDGRPWVTRLPFPVHVVERVITYDRVSGNRFVSRYAYHHGYFDGVEREFRGFGLVDEWDTEEFAAFNTGGQIPAGTNVDASSHVPPVLTRTWFHTGAYTGRDHVSDYFAGLVDAHDVGEYFREPGLTDEEAQALLLDDTVVPVDLTTAEEREACRALKGSMLRQEVYALDGTGTAEYPYGYPYTVTEQNFTVKKLQPQVKNRPAVFFTHPRESLSYHYERDPADPRVVHAMTLETNAYGDVLRSATIGYGRRRSDSGLEAADQAEQAKTHVAYTENEVTNPIDTADVHRTPVLCESRTYELTGLTLGATSGRFTFDELGAATSAATALDYEEDPAAGQLAKRLVEHVRTYYRSNDLTGRLALGFQESLGLPFENYKRAFSPGLVGVAYGGRVVEAMLGSEAGYVHTELDTGWWIPSGRIFRSPDTADTPAQELAYACQHFFLPHRYRDPFHTATVSTESVITYDLYDLLVEDVRDALDNRTTVGERDAGAGGVVLLRTQDYRVLQPRLVMDPNRNRSEVAFDALGMVVGTALMGKPAPAPVEGDSLGGFRADLTQSEMEQFLADPKGPIAVTLLGNATTRIVYDLLAYRRGWGSSKPLPAVAATLARDTHAADLPAGREVRIQASLSYSDGFGHEIQKKVQAEPGRVPTRDATGKIVVGPGGRPVLGASEVSPRWVGTGWTLYNNKGRPVRQYEPFFTDDPGFEADIEVGVSPVFFYDPVERLVATLYPNHTWDKVVFGPWCQESWDVNDTVVARDALTGAVSILDPATDADVGAFFARLPVDEYLPTWHALRTEAAEAAAVAVQYPDPDARANEVQAARRCEVHAATPTIAYADSLGRTFLTVANNACKYSNNAAEDPREEQVYEGRVVFDIEGNQRVFRDAQGRMVMRYVYDMLGNRVHQTSLEAGERWTLLDVAGKPLYSWDGREARLRTSYDALRRPTDVLLLGGAGVEVVVGRTAYGEAEPDPQAHNLRGRVARVCDQAGAVYHETYDFTGNLQRNRRRFAQQYSATLDWSGVVPLQAEGYTGSARFDALGRPVQVVVPHSDHAGTMVNAIQPGYNEAGLLERVDAWLDQAAEPAGLLDPATAGLHAVTGIDYDAKGQRAFVDYGNGVRTTYGYDPLTFRLVGLLTRREAGSFPDDCPQTPPAGWPGCQVQNLHYTYDPAGNITHVRDEAQQSVFYRNKRVQPSADYTYDAVYRLIEATGREHLGQSGAAPVSHSYNDSPRTALGHPADGNAMGRYLERFYYDATGNFTSVQHRGTDPLHQGWTRVYTYNEPSQLEPGKASNRLTSTTIGGTTETFSALGAGYDPHGNLLHMPHLQTMAWDFRDRLQMTQRQAVGPGDVEGLERQGERTWYVYDSAGERVRKVTESAGGQVTEERIYLGGFEVYTRHSGNAVTRETLHIMEGRRRVALVERRTQGTEPGVAAQRVRYQFDNQLGSAVLELDDQARVVSYEEYTPYGSTSYQAVAHQTEAPKRYRYTGKERDEESGFYYHGARYYAPWLGLWTSVDPSIVTGGEGARYDQGYVYVQGRPVVASDPDGRVLWFVVIAAVAITALTVVSPANAPTSARSPTYPRISEGQYAAHVAVNVVTGGAGSGVGSMVARRTGSLILGGATGGGVMGLTATPAHLAVSDAARGRASSPGEYARQTLRGTGMGIISGGALGGLSRLVRGPTPRMAGPSARFETPARATRATRSGGTEEVDAPRLERGEYRTTSIPGSRTRPATPEEAELISDSRTIGREITVTERAGVAGRPTVGEATSGQVGRGPEVTGTFHTHPRSGIARFSEGDVGAFQRGGYAPGTVHRVGGERWAATRQVCEAYGTEPPPFQPVVTELPQSSVPVTGPAPTVTVPLVRRR